MQFNHSRTHSTNFKAWPRHIATTQLRLAQSETSSVPQVWRFEPYKDGTDFNASK
jgi:hypothetical protein